MDTAGRKKSLSGWRKVAFEVIFEADTPAGKWFDVVLILCIVASVAVVMLDSVAGVNESHGRLLNVLEWFFTILFTIEYILRLVCVGNPTRYAVSFFGVVDLLAIVPTYARLILAGTRYFTVIRILRVLRIFRVLKLGECVSEANVLKRALIASRKKIFVFIFTVLTMVVIIGSVMFLVEDAENGFTSIPKSVYWAIVTLTTVGYGDLSPQTPFGQLLASMVMILGYCIIAVPTGIMTVELTQAAKDKKITSQTCPECSKQGHDPDADHCKYCGARL
jgi:voltage-gated potassium channel